MSLFATGSQTVGPYLHIGLDWLNTRDIAGKGIAGERVAVQGRLIDGEGVGVNDGLIEIWQANAAGKYAHPEDKQNKPLEKGWRGFGRIPTDAKGGFRFTTIKPGPVPAPAGGLQAPHLVVSVFSRGLLDRVTTRIYFADEEAANVVDPVLAAVPPERRHTLVAKPTAEGYHLDIHIQGPDETVFFAV
jgi:protocatechuate 3,4-dioxygenase alpha subunit